jgi:hypothetical protein
MGHKSRDFCRTLFKKLEILSLKSQYIFFLFLCVLDNRELFVTNSEDHDIHTRQGNNLHLTVANSTVYQKGVHYLSVNIFHNLLFEIKNIRGNPK